MTTASVPPPKAEEFLRDILDYHGEMVISLSKTNKSTDNTGNEKWAHWQSLQYFYNLFPKTHRSRYGRIHNRSRMAEVLVWACHADPYGGDSATTRGEPDTLQEQDDDEEDEGGPTPLMKWGPEEWDRLRKKLQSLRDSLIRKDANRAVGHVNREKPETDLERSELDIYNRKLADLLAMIAANKAVSPFREELETGAPVDRTLLLGFRKHVDHISDRKVRLVLEQFLVEDDSEHSESPTLADPDLLKQVLAAKPMNLNKFQKRLTQLILEWHSNTFKGRLPALVSLGYGEVDAEIARGVTRRDSSSKQRQRNSGQRTSGSKKGYGSDFGADEENQPPIDDPALAERKPAAKSPAELEQMRRARRTLYESGDDPLAAAYETAAGAAKYAGKKRSIREESSLSEPSPPAKRSKGKLYEKKTTASKIQFSSSESSLEDDEEEMETIRMSDLPQRSDALNRSASSPKRKRDSMGGPRQRRRFTEEEKRAIREGVLKHGFGNWANIKVDYAFVLNNRTNVQIKDCYRTMMRNNEV